MYTTHLPVTRASALLGRNAQGVNSAKAGDVIQIFRAGK